MLKRYEQLPKLAGVSFETVEGTTPLQAADVITTENYWHALSVLTGDGTARPHFDHFLKHVRTEGYILDMGSILQTLKDHGF